MSFVSRGSAWPASTTKEEGAKRRHVMSDAYMTCFCTAAAAVRTIVSLDALPREQDADAWRRECYTTRHINHKQAGRNGSGRQEVSECVWWMVSGYAANRPWSPGHRIGSGTTSFGGFPRLAATNTKSNFLLSHSFSAEHVQWPRTKHHHQPTGGRVACLCGVVFEPFQPTWSWL